MKLQVKPTLSNDMNADPCFLRTVKLSINQISRSLHFFDRKETL